MAASGLQLLNANEIFSKEIEPLKLLHEKTAVLCTDTIKRRLYDTEVSVKNLFQCAERVLGSNWEEEFRKWQTGTETDAEKVTILEALKSIIRYTIIFYANGGNFYPSNHHSMFPISFNDKVNKLTSLINAGIPSYIPSVWLSIVQHIMSCFEKIRLRPQNDKWLISGNSEKFRRKVLEYVVGGAPIPFVLPAFPMKSKNRVRKTISALPDMAEWISLKHLADFCSEIRKIYAPGIKLLIFGDGRLYGKILKYDDNEITEYERVFKDMLSRLPEEIHDQLFYAGIDDYFERDIGFDKVRSYIYSLYDVTMEEVDNAIRTNENINNVYKGFSRYLDEDLEGDIPKDISRTKRKQMAKDFARKLLRGNMVYTLMIKDIFPHHLRLSIHPHNNEDKVGVSLLANQRFSAGTPWHRVAAKKKDGQWYFMKRIDAEAMNYKLQGQFDGEGTVDRDNWPHFVEV